VAANILSCNEPSLCRVNRLEWNKNDEFSGFVGHVTAFDLPEDYLAKFEVQNVGGEIHNELWVMAEQLEEFNSMIVGEIRLVKTFYGEKYKNKK
jgi:hypothetical protein